MAEVTVNQLAETVGTPVDKLLAQMKEAGLTHKKGEQKVSDEDKQTLLSFLQTSHGAEAEEEPKKITLKRKTLSTLKSASGQGKKTVNVEVRKKRTFVKRTPDELQEEIEQQAKQALLDEAEAAKKAAEEQEGLMAEAAAQEAVQQARSEAEQKAKQEAEVNRLEKERLEAQSRLDPNDPEVLRQLAAARRKEQEIIEAQEREAALQAKADAEAEVLAKRKALDAAAAKKSKPVPAKAKAPVATEADLEAASEVAKKKRIKDLPKDDDDETNKKLKVKGLKDGRGKSRTHNIKVQITEDGEYEEGVRQTRRKLKRLDVKQQAFEKPTQKEVHAVELGVTIVVADLAQKMKLKVGELVKALMKMGVMATANQVLDQDTAVLLVEELGHTVKLMSETALEDALLGDLISNNGTLQARAPVVTVMGHVDHGKTSLLDYIRKAHVAKGEAGGITQHIGAYHVDTPKGMITFLDTPGHAAFTAMRARGAKSTDVVILVVAADDGVMPQTEEAVKHSRAAGVPIVVAVNKMDKEGADPDRVKNELAAKDVIPEEWGGDVQFIPVSAHTGEGIDALLEAVLLQAELLELKAAIDIPAKGVVIESRLDKGRGAIATVLVQSGVLRRGDIVLAGEAFGRIKAMVDESGNSIDEAGPSIPVEILGLNDTADAGEEFFVVESERKAREVAEFRNRRTRELRLARQQSSKLDNIFENMGADEKQVLNIVLKTDVRGSLEALQASLMDIGNEEVAVNIVSSGVGGISETDASLALTSNAVVFGFNVRADGAAKALAEKEGVDIRYYSVIYDLIDDVTKALTGMLSPELREEIVGVAEVRDVFTSPKFGLIAGSMVIEGVVHRNKPIRVLRDDVVIYQGELESLRRFKDDVAEVRNGMECGIGVKNYQDVRPGDKIEVFETKEVARTL
jgi:translation initiation factor IF-2